MQKRSDLIQQWKKDEQAPFQGWDFSYLKGRYKEENPTWDYNSIAKKLIKKSNSILDMATGGGEILSSFAPFPKKAVAIEGYHPNVAVAKKRLKPLGVKVIEANETKKLPFKDKEFDLVLNRHGGINKNSIKEIYRILSPKGIFLTQQVDGRTLKDLMKEFNTKPKWEFNTLSNVKRNLKETGFGIKEGKEWTGKIIFKDMGAIVYFLKAIPWIVDDFSMEKDLQILEKLQKRLERNGDLSFISKRFLILAKKGVI